MEQVIDPGNKKSKGRGLNANSGLLVVLMAGLYFYMRAVNHEMVQDEQKVSTQMFQVSDQISRENSQTSTQLRRLSSEINNNTSDLQSIDDALWYKLNIKVDRHHSSYDDPTQAVDKVVYSGLGFTNADDP